LKIDFFDENSIPRRVVDIEKSIEKNKKND